MPRNSPQHKTAAHKDESYENLLAIKKMIDPNDKYIGESLAILKVFKQIQQFNRNSDRPIVLLGPTGAGKTTIANMIHDYSDRNKVNQNDKTKTKNGFLEAPASSTQGDERATETKWIGLGKNAAYPNVPKEGTEGYITTYDGGTIFVDEIDALPEHTQLLLMQLLDKASIPLAAGIGEPLTPNVRLIFATNKDLTTLKNNGILKADFVARFETWSIQIPPLCERSEDILLFVNSMCKGYNPSSGFRLLLLSLPWPGNVRQLIQFLEFAMGKAGPPNQESDSQDGKRHRPELTPDHLLGVPGIPDILIRLSSCLSEQITDKMLYLGVSNTLASRGMRKGKGLQKEIARLLDWTPTDVTREKARVAQDEVRLAASNSSCEPVALGKTGVVEEIRGGVEAFFEKLSQAKHLADTQPFGIGLDYEKAAYLITMHFDRILKRTIFNRSDQSTIDIANINLTEDLMIITFACLKDVDPAIKLWVDYCYTTEAGRSDARRIIEVAAPESAELHQAVLSEIQKVPEMVNGIHEMAQIARTQGSIPRDNNFAKLKARADCFVGMLDLLNEDKLDELKQMRWVKLSIDLAINVEMLQKWAILTQYELQKSLKLITDLGM